MKYALFCLLIMAYITSSAQPPDSFPTFSQTIWLVKNCGFGSDAKEIQLLKFQEADSIVSTIKGRVFFRKNGRLQQQAFTEPYNGLLCPPRLNKASYHYEKGVLKIEYTPLYWLRKDRKLTTICYNVVSWDGERIILKKVSS